MNATPKSCGKSTGRIRVATRLLVSASLAVAMMATAAPAAAQSSYTPEGPTPSVARAPEPAGPPQSSGDAGLHLGIAVTSTPRDTAGEGPLSPSPEQPSYPRQEVARRAPVYREPDGNPERHPSPDGPPHPPGMAEWRPVPPPQWYPPPVHGNLIPPEMVNQVPDAAPAWYPPPIIVDSPPPIAIGPWPGAPPEWQSAAVYPVGMQPLPPPNLHIALLQPPGGDVPSASAGPPIEEIPSPPPRGLPEGQRIGRAPEESNAALQFLRDESVLLKPCERQMEVSLQYQIDESDFAAARLDGGLLVIDELRQRQRLLVMPLEFRMGLTPVTQGFVRVPFGWSNGEFTFAGEDQFSNSGGLGDVSAGLTREFWRGADGFPTILGSIVFSAPTGNSSLATSLTVPQSSLGEGFWTLSIAGTLIQTFDPVVIFYGAGYRHRFENNIDGFDVQPGQQAFYRFGAGFAVSPRVTFSAAFSGSFLGRDTVNGVPIEGTIREPINLRLAVTIIRDEKQRPYGTVRTVEPFVNFGLTEEAVDAAFGVSWTW